MLGYFCWGEGAEGSERGSGRRAELARALGRLRLDLPVVVFGGGRVGVVCDERVMEIREGGGGALSGRVVAGFELLKEMGRIGAAALADARADGQFALAWFDAVEGVLTLGHDPFGARRVFYAQLPGVCWFADEVHLLLAVEAVRERRALDLSGLHSYLALSFVAAPRTPFRGITCVPPNVALAFDAPDAPPRETMLLAPPESAPGERPDEGDEAAWLIRWQAEFDAAMGRWAGGVREAAVHLSGGLDSGLVAGWLARSEVRTRLFFLDFGPPFDAERPYAEATAAWLGLPLERIAVSPRRFGAGRALHQLGTALGEPWGDPVTWPLHLGYRAARDAGLTTVFNGEGGDQLLAGWPNRAMLAGTLYAGEGEEELERAARYLQTFHHFSGLEDIAYGTTLREVAAKGELAATVRRYLDDPRLFSFLDRLRWANYWLKGGQNILPRAAALARQAGVTLATPLFDRRLAAFALTIPPGLLLRGTTEKYLVKRALHESGLLPPAVIDRPKRGMGVPATAWCQGPLRGAVHGLLRRLERRDLLRGDYLRQLLRGEEVADEVRGARRIGEKLWQLALLEVWLEVGYDSSDG